MPELASSTWVLLAAMLASLASMGWLALSMPAHAAQAWGRTPNTATLRVLRTIGFAGTVVSLLLCLRADHATMAVLVWLMTLTGAALIVAFLLATRAGWLRWLAPWVSKATPSARAHT